MHAKYRFAMEGMRYFSGVMRVLAIVGAQFIGMALIVELSGIRWIRSTLGVVERALFNSSVFFPLA